MPGPTFEYIPCVIDGAGVVSVTMIEGLSTKHADTKTDRGRLYGTVGEDLSVKLYSRVTKSPETLVMTGTASGAGSYVEMAAANTSGLTGRAFLKTAGVATFVAFPTFAVDIDVFIMQEPCSKMPGYDGTYGLGYFHAAAMRQIIADALPAALPNLFGGDGVAEVVPNAAAPAQLPDMRLIANVDALRVAQASLTKALSSQQAEHTEGFAELSKLAMARFYRYIKRVRCTNVAEKELAAEEALDISGVSMGWFTRG
jgi:hypothetical protein